MSRIKKAAAENLGHNQNRPVLKWAYSQNHASKLRRRISATISGWDCPLPTFIYPGFDCGSPEGTSDFGHVEQMKRGNCSSIFCLLVLRERGLGNEAEGDFPKGNHQLESFCRGQKPILIPCLSNQQASGKLISPNRNSAQGVHTKARIRPCNRGGTSKSKLSCGIVFH